MLEPFDKLEERDTQRKANGAKLQKVEPSLTCFHLAHERLALLDPLCKFDLRQIRCLAGFLQKLNDNTMFTAVNRLIHAAACE